MIIAIIPAYNEEVELPRAVEALRRQSLPPDQIIVALNNAKPGMLEVAYGTGAHVLDLGSCPGLKAEALNKALDIIVGDLDLEDLVLVCDADSSLAPSFLAVAAEHVDDHTVVGGVFLGESGGGWLGMAQRNEYRSYAREVYAHADRAWVLTGTGTVFKIHHARDVIDDRGYLYDTEVATEDFELTVAFKELGLHTVSPRGCEVTTEIMLTPRQLHDQRTRWYRGAVETLRLHGLNRTTAPYFLQQAKIMTGCVLSWLSLALLLWFSMLGLFAASGWWLIALVPVVYRIVSAQHRWFSATIVPELVYDLLLQRALIAGWWQALANKDRVWNATEERIA